MAEKTHLLASIIKIVKNCYNEMDDFYKMIVIHIIITYRNDTVEQSPNHTFIWFRDLYNTLLSGLFQAL